MEDHPRFHFDRQLARSVGSFHLDGMQLHAPLPKKLPSIISPQCQRADAEPLFGEAGQELLTILFQQPETNKVSQPLFDPHPISQNSPFSTRMFDSADSPPLRRADNPVILNSPFQKGEESNGEKNFRLQDMAGRRTRKEIKKKLFPKVNVKNSNKLRSQSCPVLPLT